MRFLVTFEVEADSTVGAIAAVAQATQAAVRMGEDREPMRFRLTEKADPGAPEVNFWRWWPAHLAGRGLAERGRAEYAVAAVARMLGLWR